MKATTLLLCLAILGAPSLPTNSFCQVAPSTSSSKPLNLATDDEIRSLLIDRVDVQHKSVGMVVGIISPEGRRFVSYGHLNQNDPRPVDPNTIFEIGSVTKVFTSLLLADMAHRGEVSLADPVSKYLPRNVKVPKRNGHAITLVDLATHTSGLPFLPPDMASPDYARFSGYSDDQLDRFLATYELPTDPGTKWAYSNLGAGLLGRALARRAGTSYERLVKNRITGPLGMHSTAIVLTPEMHGRFGVGHDTALRAAPEWVLPVLAGAGSLRSSANDLLTFVGAFLGYAKSPLDRAMAAMFETHRPGPNLIQVLGWWVIPFGPGDPGIVTHGGETFGYASTIAYDPKTGVGIVVLSNSAQNDGGLGWHLIRPAFPYSTSAAENARKTRKEISVDTAVLDRYVGQYQPPDGGVINIKRQADALIFSSPSAPQGLHLHAETDRLFFITEADLQISFQTDRSGRATGLVVHFGGTATAAPRKEP